MKKVRVTAPKEGALKGEINLPASKSMSNRLLIMRALSGEDVPLIGLSHGDDTAILTKLLRKTDPKEMDAGIGGTTYRFLMAYLATVIGRNVVLKASGRMQQRPIGLLVNALNKMGADIRYLGNMGYPPVRIKGQELIGGRIKISGEVSSQFLTAVALVAPYTKEGVEMIIQGNAVSRHYFEMTLKLMAQSGITVRDEGQRVYIEPGEYKLPERLEVEADWSAASYWYSMAALAKDADIKLNYLTYPSLQPDAAVSRIYKGFGVGTLYSSAGAEVVWEGEAPHLNHRRFELLYNPDLAQTIAVTLVGMHESATLDGLQTLQHKETNRGEALLKELRKLNVDVELINNHKLIIDPEGNLPETAEIATYGDHRMAMAFAPLALKMKHIIIQDPDVVSKSYPNFWEDLKKVGFRVEKV